MTVVNIIDGRKRPYRYKKINAVVEAASHDNSVADSDQSHIGGVDYAENEHLSLANAISWAQSFNGEVTLYLYDQDGGIYVRSAP